MSARRAAFLAWLSLGIFWGSNFIFMKWATAYVTPLQVVLFRVAFGFLPVVLFALARNQIRLSHFRFTGRFVVMALLAAAVYYYGFARGTSLLPSGIAGAVSGAIPLFSVLAAVLILPEEKFDRYRAAGLLIGLTGVLLIARPWESGIHSASIEGVLFMVIGSMSLGVSFVYARKFITPLGLPAAALSAYQLGFAALILAIVTPYEGIGRIAEDAFALAGAVIGLGLLGTGIAYVLYYTIVEKLGAVGASTVTYLPPVVALLIGAVFVGEPIEGVDYFAATLILGGVLLLNRRESAARS